MFLWRNRENYHRIIIKYSFLISPLFYVLVVYIWAWIDLLIIYVNVVTKQVNVSEQFQRKANYKAQQGRIFFKSKAKSVLDEGKDYGLCSLFKPEPEADLESALGQSIDNQSAQGQSTNGHMKEEPIET